MEKSTAEGIGAEDKSAVINNNSDSKNSSDVENNSSDAPVKSTGSTKSASSKSGKAASKPAAKPRTDFAAFKKKRASAINSGDNSGEVEILVVDKKSKEAEKAVGTAVAVDKEIDKTDNAAVAAAGASEGIAVATSVPTAADAVVEKPLKNVVQNNSEINNKNTTVLSGDAEEGAAAVNPAVADATTTTKTETELAIATAAVSPGSSATASASAVPSTSTSEGGNEPPVGSSSTEKKKKSSFLSSVGSMFGGKKKENEKEEDRTVADSAATATGPVQSSTGVTASAPSSAAAAAASAPSNTAPSSSDIAVAGTSTSSVSEDPSTSVVTAVAGDAPSEDATTAATTKNTADDAGSSSNNVAPVELGGGGGTSAADPLSSAFADTNDIMDGHDSSFNSTKKNGGFDSGSGTEGETGAGGMNISLSSSPAKGKEFKKNNRYAKGSGGADTDNSDTDGGDYYEGRKPMSPFAKRISSRLRGQHEEEAKREADVAEAAAAKEAAAAALAVNRAKSMSPFAKRIATRVAAQNVVEDVTRRSLERLSSPDTSPERQRRQKAAVDADKPQKPRFSKNRKALNSETQEQHRQGRGAPVGGWPLKPGWTKALLALRLQSIWRGKVVRKRMRTRKTAAASVQNFFRTAKARVEAKFSVHSAVRRKAADEERARRLRDIRNKERELELLRTMPPEQYAEYDKLRANRSAGKIQRMWRDKSNDRLLQGGTDTQTGHNRQGADAFKFASKHKISQERDSVLREKKAMHTRKLNKENEFNEQVHKLLSYMDREILNIQSIAAPVIANSAAAGGDLPFFEDWCPENDAMGLALLHSKIKDKAIIRSKGKRDAVKKMGFGMPTQPYGNTSYNNPSYGANNINNNNNNNRNDSRFKFQELQDAKMRANILLEEYYKSREYMERRKAQRYRVLGNVESLKNMLAAPLTLEQGREAVRIMREVSATGGGIAAVAGSRPPSTASSAGGPPPSRPPLKQNPNSPPKQKSLNNNRDSSSIGLRTAQKWLDVYSHLCTSADNVYTSSRGAVHHDGKKILPGEWEQTAKLLESEKRLQEDTFTAAGGSGSASPTKSAAGAGSRRIDKDAKRLVEAAQLHSHTMQAVTDKNHWSVVTLPLTAATPGQNPAAAAAATAAGETGASASKTVPLQEGLNEAKIFRPLVAEWASGSDVEESLYWVSYCCQEPKKQPVTPADNDANDANNCSPLGPSKEEVEEVKRRQKTRNDELLRRVAAESLLVSRRASDAMASVEKERQKEMRLAKHYLNELLAQARASAAKELQKQLGHEQHMRMMMAAIKMQKLFRGRQARKRAEALAAQRRVQRALDNLLFELAGGSAAGATSFGLGAAGGGSAAAKALFSAVNRGGAGAGTGGPLPPPAPAAGGLSSLRPPINKQHTAAAAPAPPSPVAYYSRGNGRGERERSASPAARSTLQPQSIIKQGAWGAADPNLRMSGGLDPYQAAPSSPGRQVRSPAARKVNDFLDHQPAAAAAGGINGMLRAEASAHTRNPASTAKVLFNSAQRPAAPPGSPPTEGKFNKHNHQFSPGANSIPSGNQLARSEEQPFSPNAQHLGTERSGLLSEASSILYDADGTAAGGGGGFISPPSQSHSTAGANSFFNNKNRETEGTASAADISMNLSHSHSPRGLAAGGGGGSGGNMRAPPSGGRGVLTLSSPVREETSEDELFGTLTSHYETTGFDSPHSQQSPSRKRAAPASGLASSIEVSPRGGGEYSNNNTHKKTVTLQHEMQPTPILGASMESYDPMDPVGRLVSPTHAAGSGSPIRKPPASALQNAALRSHSTDVRAQCKGAFAEVDRRYADKQLTLGTFAESALTADPTNFSREAANDFLCGLSKHVGAAPLLSWLQKYRDSVEDERSGAVGVASSMQLVAGEITVNKLALLLCELCNVLGMDPQVPEVAYGMVSMCILLRLLGAAPDESSGCVKIHEISFLLEDAWLLDEIRAGEVVDLASGEGVSKKIMFCWQVAGLRFGILQLSARRGAGSNPRKVLDQAIAAVVNVHDGGLVHLTLKQLCNVIDLLHSDSLSHNGSSSSSHVRAMGKTEQILFALSLVKLCGWTDDGLLNADAFVGKPVVDSASLATVLCSVCSFRTLQKRLQSWFRAVPAMIVSFLQLFEDIGLNQPSVEQFCAVCKLPESTLPVTMTESLMLAHLMSRRPSTTGNSIVAMPYVELGLLGGIKRGNFLSAAM